MSWVVMRRDDCIWAVPGTRVKRISRQTDHCRLETDGKSIVADEVLWISSDLEVCETGPIWERLAPEGCQGLGICDEGPVVLIDPEFPPARLCAPEIDIEKSEDDDEV